MTTPRIEEILSKVPRSFTITTHEEHPYSSEYVDIEDMRQALTKAHQAGIGVGKIQALHLLEDLYAKAEDKAELIEMFNEALQNKN